MMNKPFTCEQVDAALSQYLEGTLAPAARSTLESHAESCGRCRALLADLAAISTQARALPEFEPSRDLWPGIAERIAAPVVSLEHAAARPGRSSVRPWYLAPAALAAAAALLIAVTSGITVLATRGGGSGPVPAGVVAANDSPASAQPTGAQLDIPAPAARNVSATGPNAVSVQEVYASEIAQLDSIVRDRRSQLDTSTVSVIEKNLHIIDQAIAQSRAALARDPNSGFLNDQLNDALNHKISLLRTVALLPART